MCYVITTQPSGPCSHMLQFTLNVGKKTNFVSGGAKEKLSDGLQHAIVGLDGSNSFCLSLPLSRTRTWTRTYIDKDETEFPVHFYLLLHSFVCCT